jgi:small subunit ribosomal protein S17
MTEEEKTEETTEEPQAEAAADAPAAGPVAEEDSSSSQAAGEEPTSTPPAEEASPTPEDPDADLPWKERARLERSRQSGEAGPQRTPEERAAARLEARRTEAAARRRYRSSQRGKERQPAEGTPRAERDANPAKSRQGVVVSDKADKTITVRIDIARRHPTYEKVVRRSRTLHAHDERNEAGEGDTVRIVETRPLSRTKRWRLVEVIEKAK